MFLKREVENLNSKGGEEAFYNRNGKANTPAVQEGVHQSARRLFITFYFLIYPGVQTVVSPTFLRQVPRMSTPTWDSSR